MLFNVYVYQQRRENYERKRTIPDADRNKLTEEIEKLQNENEFFKRQKENDAAEIERIRREKSELQKMYDKKKTKICTIL